MKFQPWSSVLSARLLCAACIAIAAGQAAAQNVVAGPFLNTATGTRYYIIQGGDYAQLRDYAVSMGGDLATIESEAENAFVVSNLDLNLKPYIGLNDAAAEGTFAWSDGSNSPFRKWRAGEPSNTASKDYVRYAGATGEWEVVTIGFSPYAIAEVAASNPLRVPQELPSIQDALIALAGSGTNRILVAPGTYDLTSAILFQNCEISGSGIGQTIVRAPTNNSGFDMRFNSVLSDMTVVNRSLLPSVLFQAGSPRVRRVEFTSLPGNADFELIEFNSPQVSGFVESCIFHTSSFAMDVNSGAVLVTNSIFRDMNSLTFNSSPGTSLRMSNCVFTRIGAAEMFDTDVATAITNSIFHENSGTIAASISISSSLLPFARPGGGNKVGAPLFTNALSNDFTLLPNSPAIDAGFVGDFIAALPLEFLDFAGNLRAVDAPLTPNSIPTLTPIDMGPFEFQPPAPVDTCKPDFNEDGFVDDTDFVTFAQFYDNFFCP